jgi:hypothetical protein
MGEIIVESRAPGRYVAPAEPDPIPFDARGAKQMCPDRAETLAVAERGAPVQRVWRDAHATASHVGLDWDAVSTMYGQHALGLPPQGQY